MASLYDEITGCAAQADPAGAPAKTNHPDTARAALAAIGERRAAGEHVRADAMLDLEQWAAAAAAAGLTVTEIARLAGVTRPTVYAILARG